MMILSGTISSMQGALLKHRQQQQKNYHGTPFSGLQTQVNNYNKAWQINGKRSAKLVGTLKSKSI